MRPNLAVMAIVFTAALFFSVVIFALTFLSLREMANLNGKLSCGIGCLAGMLFIVYAARAIGTSPAYRSATPHSERLFHVWRAAVLLATAGFTYFGGTADKATLDWYIAIVDCTLVMFYLSLLGYSIVLRQRRYRTTYAGLAVVITAAVYEIWKASL